MLHSGYKKEKAKTVACYHCGETCRTEITFVEDKTFCCEGCKLVYELLKDNSLCTYYTLNSTPGNSPDHELVRKFEYLNDDGINKKLIRFKDGNQAHVTFYIPKIHCSSCIWLLENLHKLNKAVYSSTVNFLKKETIIVFDVTAISLAEVVALLAQIGYEPLINLSDLENKPETFERKNTIVKIGLAGFCFGNIMMLSFPEYFSFGNFRELGDLRNFFGYLNLFLSLPVFFYCASGFFVSAWKSIRYRYLNIDAPIALAILVTFTRSLYEILSQSGAGYLDSMSGIVFFMLLGRYFQDKTYAALSFERDYKSYFPVGVTIKKKDDTESNHPVTTLKKGDRIIIRNNELIPCDSVLHNKSTHIDYSFITGESSPVKKQPGELIYAGARQLDGAIELEVINPTSHSYLTQLWNQKRPDQRDQAESSFVDNVNKYFTMVVLTIAVLCFGFWSFTDIERGLNSLTAVLIVACPCGLLLTSTFVNGNIIRIMGRNKFYLKNAAVIDNMSKLDTIIFDKTGTITQGISVNFIGSELSDYDSQLIASLAAQSSHPLSRKISEYCVSEGKMEVREFEEIPGKGIKAYVDGKFIILGSEHFITGTVAKERDLLIKTYVMVNGEVIGFFRFSNTYRQGLPELVKRLGSEYTLKLLSGDNAAEKQTLQKILGGEVELLFNNKPDEKMNFIKGLKSKGHRVVMIGDGLNDAGAFIKSDVAIAVSDNTNSFSPACDAILDGSAFHRLADFLSFAKTGKQVIAITFVISLAYNIIGLSFAVQGILSPVIAAILMPVSSISIVLVATISTNLIAWRKGL
jgi:Cu+-exporting ATPase